MKKVRISILGFGIAVMALMPSCSKQLNQTPKYGLNAETVYSNPDQYIHVLAKLYSGLSMTGLQGPAGAGDIAGIDEGFSAYIRVLWNLQELPTDEAKCGWSDPGIPAANKMQWNADDGWVKGMYYRIYYQITLCNEFIWQARDSKLDERGFSDADKARIRTYREEARFLRALSYYHAMDLFGNVPFVTEEDRVGAFQPERINRSDLFNYIESELLAIEDLLLTPGAAPYGRASKAAAQTLLSKLYLNAEVYTGSARNSDCITFCNKVINSGAYQLDDVYQDMFLADNNTSPEIIFPVVYDGIYAQTWGGTTYLVCGALGGSMVASNYGVNGKWGGLRTTPQFVDKFPDTTQDSRYMFYTQGQSKEITSLSTFTSGYAFPKFKNKTKAGVNGSNNGNSAHVDIDFPMFRLADVYLMLAEASFRAGDQGTALQYMNNIRERAYGNSNHNFTSLVLNDFLDERARELSWEGTRRTDLIRFGLFTSPNYVWTFKGGDIVGTGVSDHLNLYPIPNADIVLNPNLTQNPGY
ncbi:MAG: RagB/SusD family nutrient uptake outer membrane protein [Flavobacteriales bacterium]|nr:RagB/SusD family nutrient uptake outer membrane protein [Crocinitomicaceae bacterium]NBX80024.1 RagB/SusD family nutrient uptake outer membrane protein [Flavobacteriales bacterium]NCA20871.1 RagB/SusD family nutrient uptake outer membrane protein [Crocinitomicaceae bacterium]